MVEMEVSSQSHYYVYVYLGLALVSLLAVLAKSSKRRRSSATAAAHGKGDGGQLRLPPGPWQLPVVGTLHHLVGKLPHHAMRDLARRHGPVMLLRIGEVPTVVVSSRDGAREVMKTHDTTFASRTVSTTVRVLCNEGRDIVFAPYGDHWRQLRRIAVTELLSARRVLSFRAVREEEVAAMLRAVAAAAAEARPVDMRRRLSTLVADITGRAVLGDRCKDRDVFLRALASGIEIAGGFNAADLWPSWRLLGRLSGVVRRAEEVRDTVYGILDGIIEEHRERTAGETEDLIDVLLRVQKDGDLQFPLDMNDIKSIVFDIFGAGSETSATTLEWIMAELIRNPKAMKRVTEEVRHAFEGHGTVAEQKLGELQYLHLVIRETFRLHPPAPLVMPRECREQCRVLGYDVPKGMQVLVNVWAIGRDEHYWPDAPNEFRPERFEHEAAGIDFRGTDFELLPFGAGRRICPGMLFGLSNVELTLANLLFHFDWQAADVADPTKLDMTEAFGVTTRRKDCLQLSPTLRVPLPGL